MMNNSAQIHVLEVIVVAGMLLMSLYFVRVFDVSSSITTTEENELEILGNGILKVYHYSYSFYRSDTEQ